MGSEEEDRMYHIPVTANKDVLQAMFPSVEMIGALLVTGKCSQGGKG